MNMIINTCTLLTTTAPRAKRSGELVLLTTPGLWGIIRKKHMGES